MSEFLFMTAGVLGSLFLLSVIVDLVQLTREMPDGARIWMLLISVALCIVGLIIRRLVWT